LVLTKAGQLLLPAVMKSFDRLEYALDDIRNENATSIRTLRVQMPPSFAVHLAVPILRDFKRAAAEVEIDLVSPYGVGPPPGDVDVADRGPGHREDDQRPLRGVSRNARGFCQVAVGSRI